MFTGSLRGLTFYQLIQHACVTAASADAHSIYRLWRLGTKYTTLPTYSFFWISSFPRALELPIHKGNFTRHQTTLIASECNQCVSTLATIAVNQHVYEVRLSGWCVRMVHCSFVKLSVSRFRLGRVGPVKTTFQVLYANILCHGCCGGMKHHSATPVVA